MSYRKPDDIFKYNGKLYIVKRGTYDWRKPKQCDERCAFYNNQAECRKNIKITGDCQPRYRADGSPVYFELYGQENKGNTV